MGGPPLITHLDRQPHSPVSFVGNKPPTYSCGLLTCSLHGGLHGGRHSPTLPRGIRGPGEQGEGLLLPPTPLERSGGAQACLMGTVPQGQCGGACGPGEACGAHPPSVCRWGGSLPHGSRPPPLGERCQSCHLITLRSATCVSLCRGAHLGPV